MNELIIMGRYPSEPDQVPPNPLQATEHRDVQFCGPSLRQPLGRSWLAVPGELRFGMFLDQNNQKKSGSSIHVLFKWNMEIHFKWNVEKQQKTLIKPDKNPGPLRPPEKTQPFSTPTKSPPRLRSPSQPRRPQGCRAQFLWGSSPASDQWGAPRGVHRLHRRFRCRGHGVHRLQLAAEPEAEDGSALKRNFCSKKRLVDGSLGSYCIQLTWQTTMLKSCGQRKRLVCGRFI